MHWCVHSSFFSWMLNGLIRWDVEIEYYFCGIKLEIGACGLIITDGRSRFSGFKRMLGSPSVLEGELAYIVSVLMADNCQDFEGGLVLK